MTLRRRNAALIVSGVSGTGKTELAQRIAAAMNLQLLSLDTIKELIADALNLHDEPWLRRLDTAALGVMLELARGPHGVVMDAYWRPSLRSAVATFDGTMAEIFCTCPADVLRPRLEQRRIRRHRIHRDAFDPSFVDNVAADLAEFQPLAIGPLLKVDTSRPTDVRGLCQWVADALSLELPPDMRLPPPKERLVADRFPVGR